jgi:hypothetical protein
VANTIDWIREDLDERLGSRFVGHLLVRSNDETKSRLGSENAHVVLFVLAFGFRSHNNPHFVDFVTCSALPFLHIRRQERMFPEVNDVGAQVTSDSVAQSR